MEDSAYYGSTYQEASAILDHFTTRVDFLHHDTKWNSVMLE